MDVVSIFAIPDSGINLAVYYNSPIFSLEYCWFSYHLAQRPDVLERLNAEIESKLCGRTDFTREDLKKMGYLENVLRESKFLVSSLDFFFFLIS